MKSRIATVLLVMITFLSGCPEGGIYSTLENETKTTDNTLNNDMSIHGVATLGLEYYVAAGRVWKGTLTPSPVNWDTTTPVTPPATGALCTALVAFGADLYGGFITQSANVGLYKATGPSPTTFEEGQITDAGIKDRQIVLLSIVNSNLVVSTAIPGGSPYTYDLLLSLNGSTYSTMLFATSTKPFTGVAYTSASGGRYWAVSGTLLYSGTGVSDLVPAASPTGATSSEVLTSVFSDDGAAHLFVTSNLGYVYYSSDAGVSWTRNATEVKVSDTVVSFLTVAGGSGQSRMLVGSDGYGYYILDTAVSPPTLARFGESTIGLYTASVSRFLIDGSRLFACTNKKGLWRNETFSATDCSVGSWVQE
jgi:hypothetical protein